MIHRDSATQQSWVVPGDKDGVSQKDFSYLAAIPGKPWATYTHCLLGSFGAGRRAVDRKWGTTRSEAQAGTASSRLAVPDAQAAIPPPVSWSAVWLTGTLPRQVVARLLN